MASGPKAATRSTISGNTLGRVESRMLRHLVWCCQERNLAILVDQRLSQQGQSQDDRKPFVQKYRLSGSISILMKK